MKDELLIAVISGGNTPLAPISRVSGEAIAKSLRKFYANVEHLEFDDNLEQRLDTLRPDVVFPTVSDVELFKLLETYGLHFVGSGIHANYLTQRMNRANHFLRLAGVPVEDAIVCTAQDNIAEAARRAAQSFPDGCLVGNFHDYELGTAITLCKTAAEIVAAIERELAKNGGAVVERLYRGWREISVFIIEDLTRKVLPIVEVLYDDNGESLQMMCTASYHCPASLSEEIASKVQRYALTAYQALGCEDFARIDVVISEAGEIIVEEVHAVPMLTPSSLVTVSANASGISFDDLVCQLVRRALDRSLCEIKIASHALPPGNILSNFAANPFTLDGVAIAGMEGLLQSLKVGSDEVLQRELCGLSGKEAKQRGAEFDKAWQATQTLYWKQTSMSRAGAEYQDFLDRAYDALFAQSEAFREALIKTCNRTLSHSLGNVNPNNTVLTEQEFVGRLYALRRKVFASFRSFYPY